MSTRRATAGKRPSPRVTVANVARRWWLVAVGIAVIAAIVIGAVACLPSGRSLPPTRAREYRDITACLVTPARGLADPGANAVWAGMQDASAATLVQVSYLAAAGPDTVENVLPYAASLVQRRCHVIVAVGPVVVEAAARLAAVHPEIHFVLVGGGGGANVSTVPAGEPAAVRAAVAGVIQESVPR